LRDGTILREDRDRIEYGPQLISTYAVEIQSVPVEKKTRWGKKVTIQQQQQVKVPIMSWPYSAITKIDWGYMDPKTYAIAKELRDKMAKAKQAEDAKKQEKSNESAQEGESVQK
jgi:hypothetical protein